MVKARKNQCLVGQFSVTNSCRRRIERNFRMSRPTFLLLCEELRPFVQKKATNMRLPVDVERQVASTLYYLSDEGRIRKTANAFGLSRSVISNIIRRVCIAITVHLGSKYIKLPFTEAKLGNLFPNLFSKAFQTEINRSVFIKYDCVDANQLFRFY